MKAVLTILIGLCFTAAKAQTPKIHIDYDENGNRIFRYWTPYKPGSSKDSSNNNEITEGKSITTDENNPKNGLEALKQLSFKVYPNPSNDNFNIAIDASMLQMGCEISLTDQLGRVHYQQKAVSAITTISTAHLADGVYYVILNYGSQKSTVKLVKEVSY